MQLTFNIVRLVTIKKNQLNVKQQEANSWAKSNIKLNYPEHCIQCNTVEPHLSNHHIIVPLYSTIMYKIPCVIQVYTSTALSVQYITNNVTISTTILPPIVVLQIIASLRLP